MYSDVIKSSLENEVVGQTRAINTIVRGVTRLVSGLTPRERQFGAYLFMGPTGTGKTHLIQTLARLLHGDEQRVVVADCSQFIHGDPRMALATQLAPLFAGGPQQPGSGSGPLEAPPLSIIQFEFLEHGSIEVSKALAAALETAQVMSPEGGRWSLRNCLIFLTSGLCAGEILNEEPRIGFGGVGDEAADDEERDEEARIYKTCYERAVEHFGSDLMGRLDRFVIFHPLQDEHLGEILDRRVARLNGWLAARGFCCELQPEARAFLLEKGRKDLRRGARDLLRAHQTLVEFPLSDLLVSGRVPPGGVVQVERRRGEEHLHFTVLDRELDADADAPAGSPSARQIAIA